MYCCLSMGQVRMKVLSTGVKETRTSSVMVPSSTPVAAAAASSDKNVTGMIIGIAIGCGAFLLLLFILAGYIARRVIKRKGEMKVQYFLSIAHLHPLH